MGQVVDRIGDYVSPLVYMILYISYSCTVTCQTGEKVLYSIHGMEMHYALAMFDRCLRRDCVRGLASWGTRLCWMSPGPGPGFRMEEIFTITRSG